MKHQRLAHPTTSDETIMSPSVLATENVAEDAIIYCRVSDPKQMKKGSGLNSQEVYCRAYADLKKYNVVQIFQDEHTGGVAERPGMRKMLTFLKAERSRSFVVIIDDITRLARGLEVHLYLRKQIAALGARLESPSMAFGNDAVSRYVENVVASTAEFQRSQNAEQVKKRMRSRMLDGYWVFRAPPGYRYQLRPGRGKMLVPDGALAPIVTEALESFASGHFASKTEVLRFLESQHQFASVYRDLKYEQVNALLNCVAYAGHVEYLPWGVSLRPAQHEGLISITTFLRIRERLNGKPHVPTRKDLALDFPLRGFVACADCGCSLTSAWSKGRNESYPYYLCQNRKCPSKGKSIRRDDLEGQFEAILSEMQPSEDLLSMATAMFQELWDRWLMMSRAHTASITNQLSVVEKKLARLVDRIVDANDAETISSYETAMKRLELTKAKLREELDGSAQPLPNFDEVYRTALEFLGKPHKLWVSGGYADKRTVLKLAFSTQISYCRKLGFRTVNPALPFKVLADLEQTKSGMVGPAGFEPATTPL